MINDIFKKRRILIITDEDITNVPLSSRAQLLITVSVVFFIAWISFSSGKYFSFRHAIEQKESEVQKANLINLDLQTKIDSLQGNLVRLNEYFNSVRDLDHNKEQKNQKSHSQELSSNNLPFQLSVADSKLLKNYNFSERLSFGKKNKVIDDINSNTIDRIDNIKRIVAMTGLSVSDMKDNNGIDDEIAFFTSNYKNQGGPNTENISKPNYIDKNIDDEIHFSENIEQLVYLEHVFNSVPFTAPMKRYYISSRYGFRTDPLTKRQALHYGVDFAGPPKANVYSTAPGIVKFSGRKGNYGKFVEIDHGFNIVTRYGHLSKLKVKKGDRVERNQLIGHQGNTGRSSGPHLHYEIRFNDKHYDPQKFLTAGRYVF